MDALELLKSDHEQVKGLFDSAQQTADGIEKRAIFQRIKQELLVHTHVEETIFYPTFNQYDEFADILDDAYDEHQDIQELIEEIDVIDEGEDIDERLEELREAVDYHVQNEEEELFPMIRSVMSSEQLDQLGIRLGDAKESTRRAA
jgi:iron-sulfur cluster repair protein YtfE (RIC family)